MSKKNIQQKHGTKEKMSFDSKVLLGLGVVIAVILVGAAATIYFWDVQDNTAKKEDSASFQSAKPEVSSDKESLMQKNCTKTVLETFNSSDAVVTELGFKNFPWVDGSTTSFMVDGFDNTEMRFVVETSEESETFGKAVFLCKSLSAKGETIEVSRSQ